MTDPHRLMRLDGCHPELVVRVKALLADCLTEGYCLVLTQGVRTVAQQQALYNQGRTRPGKIVTNCDGVRRVSNHQPKSDGWGYAVDVAWRLEDGSISWEGPWPLLGLLAKKHGLIWGGGWKFQDFPHLEWHLDAAPSVTRA